MLSFKEFKEYEEEMQEEKALKLVKKGVNLQRGNDFWEDFLRLCGDSEGMAALLGVARDKITGLSSRIERFKSKLGDDNDSQNDKIIKTGDL